MPNRLANAASPYLLQHRDNPVDWYEWGDDAFAAAASRDVPILLSVGYSACHWCHVMAHESFEDAETAALMNRHFVNVKVDREERPDVDRVYMDAVTGMTGRGGWPMTVFLTPDGRPFYAGTYFPSTSRHGIPAFREVLEAIVDAWAHDRTTLESRSADIVAAISARAPEASTAPTPAVFDTAVDTIAATFDPIDGGFGGAPKFPQPSTLEFLLRYAALRPDEVRSGDALAMVDVTLDRMARGGIYDHLHGGFARYSVDARWLVPHFEKMLYDNALLARTYLRAWQVTGRPRLLAVARETLDYLARDMKDPSGGLHSSDDADAGGVEGAHAVWTWSELGDVLGDDRDLAALVYGATAGGNFEGANILHLPRTLADAAASAGISEEMLGVRKASMDERLRAASAARVRPHRDDKIVTAWNGFALRAFAEASAVLDDDGYRETAVGIATFLVETAFDGGRLLRSWRHGRIGPDGFCEDYAATIIGLLALYQATGDERWYTPATDLGVLMIERFADADGGFFATPDDGESLIARPKNGFDHPTPSDNALAAEAVAMLAAYGGDEDLHDRFEGTVRSLGTSLSTNPAAHGHLLSVWLSNPLREVAVVGDPADRAPFLDVIRGRFRPDVIVSQGVGGSSNVPLLEGRSAPDGARAFVCRGFACDLPANSARVMGAQLDAP